MRETVELGERKVTILGTAHVSSESVREVSEVIDEVDPDWIGVELDQDRLESLQDRSGWREMNVGEAIREGKGGLLLMNLILSIYQRKIGIIEGIEPGEEMLQAVESAEQKGIDYGLIDRPVNQTISRLRSELSIWQKYMLLISLFFDGEESMDVEELKKKRVLEHLVEQLEDEFPDIKQILLDERNSFMAEKILEKDFDHAVIVVGAAHVSGLKGCLESDQTVNSKEDGFSLPVFKTVKYAFPALIIGGMLYSFYRIGFSTGVEATTFWIVANGSMAMLGAILARSHILTWVVSFISAPLTSLYPGLGAGMVASYFEAHFYPPKVGELEKIAYLESYRDLWGNQVGRILLTFMLVSIGSSIATFAGAGYILSLIA